MAMQHIKQLFQFELGDMYDAEQRIVQMLPQMANECKDGQALQRLPPQRGPHYR